MTKLFPPPKILSPKLWVGMRVGLLGGSFNPPHVGHVHASHVALKYLNLDAVWWLVSPQNPLKNNSNLPSVAERSGACAQLTRNHNRIIISDIETQMKTSRSFDTVTTLQKKFPHTKFIWLAGTDIAHELHRWHRPRETIKKIPFAFIGRPTLHGIVRTNLPRRQNGLTHHILNTGTDKPLMPQDIYWLFADPLRDISSTLIRP